MTHSDVINEMQVYIRVIKQIEYSFNFFFGDVLKKISIHVCFGSLALWCMLQCSQ